MDTIQATCFVDYMKERLNMQMVDITDLQTTYKLVNHNEYLMVNYFVCLREYCRQNDRFNSWFTFVDDESISDIKITLVDGQTVIFKNMRTNKSTTFGIEYDVPIPYFTGIYNLTQDMTSWKMRCKDERHLLSYVGGSWRGPLNNKGLPIRKDTIARMQEYNNTHSHKYPQYTTLFCCPILANSHEEEAQLGWSNGNFSIKAKEVYWNSVFSWHPCGDTPSRRGFYEALLLGNIPVISRCSYDVYKMLLVGENHIQHIAIVIDDARYFDADFVMNLLLRISDEDIAMRQARISEICHRLQWGFYTKGNALLDMIQGV
jgi:hypothetical protein